MFVTKNTKEDFVEYFIAYAVSIILGVVLAAFAYVLYEVYQILKTDFTTDFDFKDEDE